jgi:uncharacterized membrane protein
MSQTLTAIKELSVVATIMLAMDALWLAGNNAYHRQVFAALQGQPLQVRWLPAVAVYALMIIGVWFFAVSPTTDWSAAAGRGALMGAVMYGLYDLTNYATLVRYPLRYALTDLAWGIFLCTVVAGGARWVLNNVI